MRRHNSFHATRYQRPKRNKILRPDFIKRPRIKSILMMRICICPAMPWKVLPRGSHTRFAHPGNKSHRQRRDLLRITRERPIAYHTISAIIHIQDWCKTDINI